MVAKLNFKEKVERSLALIEESYRTHGDSLVVANSLGKDSVVVWDLPVGSGRANAAVNVVRTPVL